MRESGGEETEREREETQRGVRERAWRYRVEREAGRAWRDREVE